MLPWFLMHREGSVHYPFAIGWVFQDMHLRRLLLEASCLTGPTAEVRCREASTKACLMGLALLLLANYLVLLLYI